MKEKDQQDEIIAAVRVIREELAAQFEYDVDRLYEEAKRRERASSREKLPGSPKRIQPVS